MQFPDTVLLIFKPNKITRAVLMDGKVSVITPVYNEIKTLRLNIQRIQEALRGVPHEIIIVDDNSPDGSGVIADSIAEVFPNIKVLHRSSKKGLGTA